MNCPYQCGNSEEGSSAHSWPPIFIKVTVISGWNGSYGSIAPKGHVRGLDLVMRVLTGAHLAQNYRLRGSFLARNPHV